MRSSSYWGKLNKADTSVSSITADSSRKLACLFSSPISTPRTWLIALPWTCAPPAWRHEHIELQSLESAPELGIWVCFKARQSWFGEHPLLLRSLQQDEEHSRLDSSSFCPRLTPKYPWEKVSTDFLSPRDLVREYLTRYCTTGRICAYPFLRFLSRIVLWVFHLVENLTMLSIFQYVYQS